jgi:hypothetical protein
MKSIKEILNYGKRIIGTGILIGTIMGCQPSVSPSAPTPKELTKYPGANSKIEFVESSSGNNSVETLWIMNSDGTDLKKIYSKPQNDWSDWDDIENEVSQDYLGGFSPDGTKLLFAGTNKIEISDLEGKILHEFDVCSWGDYVTNDFRWTPDGKSVLYGRVSRYDLADESTHELNPINMPETDDHNPVMSPNLEKIAFIHHENMYFYTIYTINSNGTGKDLIATGESGWNENLNLDWVDNTHLVWKNERKYLYTSPVDIEIDYCDIQTKQITKTNLDPSIYFSKIRLSPDKKTLALCYTQGADFVSISDISTGVANSQSGAGSSYFGWSQDGNYVATGENYEGAIWRILISDKERNQYGVLKSKDFPNPNNFIDHLTWSGVLNSDIK